MDSIRRNDPEPTAVKRRKLPAKQPQRCKQRPPERKKPTRVPTSVSLWPKIQLYHLGSDISEENNLFDKHPEKVKELYDLLMMCINNGRSTDGEKQVNDLPFKGKWIQYEKLQSVASYPW